MLMTVIKNILNSEKFFMFLYYYYFLGFNIENKREIDCFCFELEIQKQLNYIRLNSSDHGKFR